MKSARSGLRGLGILWLLSCAMLFASSSRAGPNLGSAEDFNIAIEIDPPSVVAHQQVVLRVRVEHPNAARASWKPPAFEGFWMERLATRTSESDSDGRRVTSFRRALFPARTGTLEIPESHLLLHRKGEPDRKLEVPGASVKVTPLPRSGPGSTASTPMVGKLQIRVSAAESRIRIGESLELLLELWGEGNIWDASIPDLDRLLGDSVEVFPANRRLFVGESNGRATTRWTLRFSLVVSKPGRYLVPEIEFPYFDPDAKSFRVARSDALAFEVVSKAAALEKSPWENEKLVTPPQRLPWTWIIGIAFTIGLSSVLYLRRWQRSGFSHWAGPKPPSPRESFEAACQALGTERLTELLSDAVKAGIQVRHRFDAVPLTTDEIAERIDDREAIDLLRQLDARRFAGHGVPPESLLASVREYLRL